MKELKVLFATPTPLDNIPEVIKAQQMKGWPCDRIMPKFMTEYFAYNEIRNYFLENKKYTHLALAADDIIVEPRHLKFLIEDLMQYNFPVLSGVESIMRIALVNTN